MTKDKRIEKHYYLLVFLQFFMAEVTGTTCILYLQHKGMSLLNVNMIWTVFFMVILFMEIPTGIIADLYGRKVSVTLGFLCYGIWATIFLVSDSLIGFMIGQIFGGIGLTLQSGALEAWVVDTSQFYNSKVKLENLFSRGGVIRNFSGILSGIIGGYIASVSYEYTWIISVVLAFLTMIIAFFIMEEPYFKRKEIGSNNAIKSMTSIVKDSIDFGFKNRSIVILFIVGIFINFSNSAANNFQQPRVMGLWGGGIWIIGWLKAGYCACMIFGSWLIGYLSRNKKDHYQLLFYTCFMIGFWLILSGVFNSFASVMPVFFIYEIGRGMYRPARQIFLNYRIPTDKRATLLSFESAISKIGMILGLIITGAISRNFVDLNSNQLPIRVSWVICGAVAVAATLVVFLGKRQIGRDSDISISS